MLIVFSGLPGARELSKRAKAVYIRIDTIEQAIRISNILKDDMAACGYNVAYGLACDNLNIGNTVIADSVNSVKETRDRWLAVGQNSNARIFEIEIVCSDPIEHQRRVENREPDIEDFKLPR